MYAAGLDDHIVEAVKLALRDAQPELTRLSLQSCEGDYLWFARVGKSEPPFGLHRSMYDHMAEDAQQIQLLLPPLWGGSYVSAEKCLAA